MLTKSDLSQIQKIVRTETTSIVAQELTPVKKDVKSIKSDLKKVKKTVDVMAKLFDAEDVMLGKKVRRIEDHLGFVQP